LWHGTATPICPNFLKLGYNHTKHNANFCKKLEHNMSEDDEDSQTDKAEKTAIGERFCQECARLGWGTQIAIARRLAGSHRTVSAIFSSHRTPGALLLARAGKAGMDLHYVLTGEQGQAGAQPATRALEQRITTLESAIGSMNAIANQVVPTLGKTRPMAEPARRLTQAQIDLLEHYAQAPESTRRIIRTILQQNDEASAAVPRSG
jgi:hypothetical protein